MAIPKTWPLLLVLTLVGNLALAGGPWVGEAHACSCAASRSTDEAFRRSDAVFSGEVVEIGEQEDVGFAEIPGSMSAFLAPVTFDVKESWKGVSGESAVVYGQGPSASCGLDFERGETYLVFAGRAGEGEDRALQTDSCGNTSPASVETARNNLGPPPGTLPETGGVALESATKNAAPTYVAPTVVFALTTGVLFAAWSRRERRR